MTNTREQIAKEIKSVLCEHPISIKQGRNIPTYKNGCGAVTGIEIDGLDWVVEKISDYILSKLEHLRLEIEERHWQANAKLNAQIKVLEIKALEKNTGITINEYVDKIKEAERKARVEVAREILKIITDDFYKGITKGNRLALIQDSLEELISQCQTEKKE